MDSQDWYVEFYVTAQGRSPALEFINGLPVHEQAKVRNALRLLREFGDGLGMPHAKHLSGYRGLWELRPGDQRLLYFAHAGRRFIVLCGFTKKGRRTPPAEIRRAERYRADFLERENG